MSENLAGGYAPVLGPVDRESFHDAQVRHRRASRRFTAFSALAILLTGLPLSAVISPLLYGLAVLVIDLVNLVADMPDPLAFVATGDSSGDVPPEMWPVIVAALVLPGSVAMLLAWLGVRRAFRRAGSGTALLALGARDPGDDLEERQLRNVVEEMAAAAGIAPPRVMLLDSDVPNAVAVGSDVDDATVVVTTGLLTLDRAETQAVVGHVVGSVGNGDLRIGTTLASVFQTLGLVETVLRAPGERAQRATLRRLLRYAFRRKRRDDNATMAALLMRAGTELEVGDDPTPNAFMSVVLVPFLMAGLAFTMTRMIFGWLVVNPFLRRAWRARKHLADATAVQLTRDPGALARALTTLNHTGDVVPGTEWASYLFVVGRRAQKGSDPDTVTFNAPVPPRVDRLRAMGADVASIATVYSRGQRAMLALVLAVTSPCWLTMLGLLLACGIVLTLVSLAIDALFLAPMVAIAHIVLRGLAG